MNINNHVNFQFALLPTVMGASLQKLQDLEEAILLGDTTEVANLLKSGISVCACVFNRISLCVCVCVYICGF